ncbi:MAG TPA: GNAT family N-acetyltransferase [Chitinophagaceae bacterium]|jgi:GNAT superfamily N-acetyltransferase
MLNPEISPQLLPNNWFRKRTYIFVKNKLMANQDDAPFLSHVEPVLAVHDVIATTNHWNDTLGFTNKWTWGDPPNHGGVSWHGVYIQFSQNPELATVSKGNVVFIKVKKNLEMLYEFHQRKNAEIVVPLENKPWGLAGYTVKELNGYYLNFGGPLIYKREEASTISSSISIIPRIPHATEYLNLLSAVGWHCDHSLVEKILSAPIYGVVAEDVHQQAIGCALLLSDGASFYYIKDVMVHPDWQHKHVGSMLMKQLSNWLDENAPANAYVGLFTGEPLAPFYMQFDFIPVYGMKRLSRKVQE